MVATSQRRGAELFVSDLVRQLNRAGVEQCVAVLRASEGAAVAFEAPTVLLRSDGWRVPGLRIDPRTARDLRTLIARLAPDVAQAHGGEALKYLALCKTRGLSVVYRRIGAAPPWLKRGPRKVAYARLMRRASTVVGVAEEVARETVETFGLPPAKVVAIPNAVDAERMRPATGREETRRLLGIPPSAGVVLSLGALTWEKDPSGHLEITAPLLEERCEAIHLFVGDGPMKRGLEDEVRARHLGSRVRLLGTREDVPDIMAASDVLLIASAVEGMPGSVIEAGIVGLPVAGYAIAGVPEVVLDGVTGKLAPVGQAERLRALLRELLMDEDGRRTMGAAARERCLSMFDIPAVALRYLELYQELTVA